LAWVEQKNGAIVRRLVGYGRLEGLASAQAVARLLPPPACIPIYSSHPSNCGKRPRIGARVIKRYHRRRSQ
jgi:hypothetical protein